MYYQKFRVELIEWAGIRQVYKLVDANLIDTWMNNHGLERINYGRNNFESLAVYIATHTPGENLRQKGVLKKQKVPQCKKPDGWCSLNEGVSVSGPINNIDGWKQRRLQEQLVCTQCSQMEADELRMRYHMLAIHFSYIFKCRKCHLVGNIEKIEKHKCRQRMRFSKQSRRPNRIQQFLRKATVITAKFLRENPDTFISNSDKGNKTVICDRHDYKFKMLELLGNITQFHLPQNDPTYLRVLHISTTRSKLCSKNTRLTVGRSSIYNQRQLYLPEKSFVFTTNFILFPKSCRDHEN